MKKRRLECDVSCAGANVPLVVPTTVEITGETETETSEGLSTNIVDDHSENESDEISDGHSVVQGTVQITELLAEKEARCEELESVVLEFEGKMKESEAKLKESYEKNADLEAANAKLKETSLRYESQLCGESQASSAVSDGSHQQTAATDAVVKEMQKAISTLESIARCLTMESLRVAICFSNINSRIKVFNYGISQGSHLFGNDVHEISDAVDTSCIVLYNTAPT